MVGCSDLALSGSNLAPNWYAQSSSIWNHELSVRANLEVLSTITKPPDNPRNLRQQPEFANDLVTWVLNHPGYRSNLAANAPVIIQRDLWSVSR